MSLNSGPHLITSLAGKLPIGRSPREDFSLNPKRVLTLPEGIKPPVWLFEKLPNGNFILRIGNNPTATFDRLLWAILLEEPRPSEWKIQARPQAGPNTYTIELANSPEGWVVAEEGPERQISVRPLIVGPSEPPFFPPTELFVIVPLLRD